MNTESGIALVTGSSGTIGSAVMRRFAGRFDSIVGFDGKAPKPPLWSSIISTLSNIAQTP